MQKNNRKSKLVQAFLFRSLAMLLFVAAAIAANQDDYQAGEQAGQSSGHVTQESQGQQGEQDPKAFVPSEKLSADMAVAFPTDI